MVDYKYKDLFYQSHIDKQLKIETDDGLFTATNSDVHFEDFELTESLCSDSELRFGSCEASMVKFQIRNAFIPLVGKWITITETLDGKTDKPFQYGRYKVFSDKPTADREYRDIVAYDAMYDIIEADLAEWYNTILPNNDSVVTLKQFRTSLMNFFGLEQEEKILVNDDMIVKKTIQITPNSEEDTEDGYKSVIGETLSGRDVLTSICEINGCFGHIGRDGKFHYIYLPQDIQGLYPADFLYPDHVPEQWNHLSQADTGHLYPQDPKGARFGSGKYIKCQYEDYIVRQINKIQIRQEENDIGTICPKTEPSDKDNSYIIQDNFLVYGKSTEELDVIAENIYGKIKGIIYRPFNAECQGNPCFEVGDPIRLATKYALVESYILSRTLKGIQSLRDSYSSKGFERRSQNVNSAQKSIIQLKGKANILTRTIEETKLEMYDIEKGINNTIAVTAEGLQANITKEAERAQEEETKLSNNIKVTAEGLQANITKEQERAEQSESKLTSSISATAESLKTEVERATGQESMLKSQIEQNASSIEAEVSRASSKEEDLSASVKINADNITTKVSKGTVSSEISQESGIVSISADRFKLESSNLNINPEGAIMSTNGTFESAEIICNYSEGADEYPTSGLHVQRDGTTKINFIAVGNGGVASKGEVHSETSVTSKGNITADGNVTGYFIGAGNGGIATTGTKARIADTSNYGNRTLYCYETPSPIFGDIGEGKTDEAGTCMIFIDDIFLETIENDCQYQVFLQPYGNGKCYVSERKKSYFIVIGDAFLKFGWELKAIQKGYNAMRLEIAENNKKEQEIDLELEDYMKKLLYDIEVESEEIL